MKQVVVFLIGIFSLANVFSQHVNNKIWYFGAHAGIDFNNTPPTALGNSAMYQQEGCSTMCDSNGQLLFYSSGFAIWNRNHQLMVNGQNLFGDISATQSVLILPMPGSTTLYYVFTVPAQHGLRPFAYSIVDMTLDGGLGAVTTKNVPLLYSVTEKLTATLNSNGIDYWVVVKPYYTNAFAAFSVTTAGVNPTPVFSYTGFAPNDINNTVGYARISPDGRKLAATYFWAHLTQLFDFDNTTGVVSNPIDLTTDNVTYGVEFSANSSKLYVMQKNECVLKQYDLTAGSPTGIQNSVQEVVHLPSEEGSAIMLGPDAKIYMSHWQRKYVSVIDQPNLAGAACNFIYHSLDLTSNSYCYYGLPNNLFYLPPCPPTLNYSNSVTICSNQSYQLPSGATVSVSGIYQDTIRSVSGSCDSIINTVNVSIFPVSLVNTAVQICSNQTYTLPSGTIVSTPGIYQDTIRSVGSCDSSITTVNLSVFPVSYVNTTAQICSGQTYTLPSGTVVGANGIYLDTVRSVAGCDSSIATINLSVFPVSLVNTAVQICSNQTYALPSGIIVGIAGIYLDTLRSVAGCDSSIATINLSVLPVSFINTTVQICSNHSYQLPSGAIVSVAGIYIDTLRSVAGCDSIITDLDLSVFPVILINTEEHICSNQTYQLPSSGIIISAAGFYMDTTRSVSSCDSIINTIHVLVSNVTSSNVVDSIYDGDPYVLPSGQTITTAGIYQSVLVNSVGCDSVITTIIKLRKKIADCLTLKNAITPNGDGINDYWVLYKYFCFKKLEVNIYNRYGSLVYHSDDYKNDWNGKYKNKELPDGTYYYIIKVIAFDEKEHVFKDNVTILR